MNYTIALDYTPHAKQAVMHASNARFLVVSAGVRGGKTKSTTVKFLDKIYADLAAGKGRISVGTGRRRMPRLRYWVVGPIMPLTKYPHEYILGFVPHELVDCVSQTDYSVWLKPDIVIEFKTAERPDLLVGADVDGMLLTEACRIKAEAWRGALRGRLSSTKGWTIFESSPLGGRYSWVYQEIVANASVIDGVERPGDPDIASFSWRTIDNPYIDPAEVEAARRQLPDAWFKRDYEASWDSFGGQIYDEFKYETHVTTEERFRFEHGISRDRPWSSVFNKVVGTFNPGFAGPGCLLAIGEMGDGNWLALDESYASGRRPATGSTVTWLGECLRFQSEYGIRDFVGDPEDAGALFDLRNNGINIRAANKNVFMGIRRVASALHPRGGVGRPGLRILDRCKNLIREISGYQWKPVRDGSGFLEEPADGQSDHALDCLRYGAMELKLYDYAATRSSAYQSGPAVRPMG